ncbi:MAG: protein-export chaperone SecB [Syntrophobacteraceae bacterium]
MFPYVRKLVSEICRRGGLPPVYLQPVNFVQLHKDGILRQAQSG